MAEYQGIWVPCKFTTIVSVLHCGMQGRVLVDCDLAPAFDNTNSVKQGCVLALLLFCIFFAAGLQIAINDLTEGMYIRFCTNGKLFNLCRQQASLKTTVALIKELLSADDSILVAQSVVDLQKIVDHFANTITHFGLTISIPKTKILDQPLPGSLRRNVPITINYVSMKTVDMFPYLGSVVELLITLINQLQLTIVQCPQGKYIQPENLYPRDITERTEHRMKAMLR